MPKLTAFVARSFDPADDTKIDPIIRFLDTFRTAGFMCETAEPAEVELVHKKVRDLIDGSDVFVGIFTRRYPVCSMASGLKAAFNVLRGRHAPTRWCPPLWVLQESGYALAKDKKLIIFRETDVELPALQGDLEYIPYEPSNPTPAFLRASEMINRLIALAAGTTVETVVRELPKDKETESSLAQAQAEETAQEAPTTRQYYFEMIGAIEARNWQKAKEAYEQGLQLIRKEGEGDAVIFWRGTYCKRRCLAGDAEAFDDLRALAEKESTHPHLMAYLGECFLAYRDYEQATSSYERAASLGDEADSVDYRVTAAKCLRLGKRPGESRQVLLSILKEPLPQSSPEVRFRILRELYETMRESGDIFHAFSIGERALQENPGHWDLRFSLAYAYSGAGNPEMSTYHYRLAAGPDTHWTFNNLGVAYSNCNLPILSASSYRKAIELGNTLAASNLGRMYLQAGLADEAASILRNALAKEDCDQQVTRTLAAVVEQRQEETKKEEAIIDAAHRRVDFLISLSGGLLSETVPSLAEGLWSFPFGQITLRSEGDKLVGETTVEVPEGLAGRANALYGLGGLVKAPTVHWRFQFRGKVDGRTCHYHLTKETVPEPLFSSGTSTTEGYIVFSADGKWAEVAESKDRKLEDPYRISRPGAS